MLCPCQSGLSFEDCCSPALSGISWPQTPEKLMRSRYTAYALKNVDWLVETWAESERDSLDFFALEEELKNLEYTGLKILEARGDRVSFEARHREAGGRGGRLKENSRFIQKDGRWYYLNDQ